MSANLFDRGLMFQAAEAALALGPFDRFDCVVTDYLMPGQNGVELAHRLHTEHPALPILLLSASVAFKLLLITGLTRALGAPMGTALRTGLYLTQAGEFARAYG